MTYLDALIKLPQVLGPQVSPDGKWVAWSAHGIHPAIEVYVAPSDASKAPQQLTASTENTILISWRPDSKGLIVGQDEDGNERTQLFMVMLDQPKKMSALTEEKPAYFIRGGHLHPDGKWLVYGANVDPNSKSTPTIDATWIIRHDIKVGARKVLAKPQKAGYIVPMLSPDGKHVLYTRMDESPAGRQLWLVEISGKNDREILNVGADKKTFGRWCPDSQRIVVRAETETHQKVGLYDIEKGETKWLLDDKKRNIESAFMPPGSNQIVVVEIKDASLQASLLDPESGEESKGPKGDGNVWPLAPVGNNWLSLVYSATQPTDLMVLKSRGKPDSVSRVWDHSELKEKDFCPAEDFRWKADDQLAIQGWLYRSQAPKAKGTIIYVHGGPTAHSQNAIYKAIQYFTHEGFNVLAPNYRGSTGFSIEFREKIRETGWGGLEQDDIRSGIEALIKAGIAEKGKIGIMGTSYGGYSSWCAITRYDKDTVAAAAPICGMTDLVVDYQTTRPDLRPYSEEMLGGKPDEVPDRYRERSPIHFVENITGRLMIVQGLQDPNVTPANVSVVTAKLQEAGIEYELLAFADEGHGIYKPQNQKRLWQNLLQFFTSAFTEKAEE